MKQKRPQITLLIFRKKNKTESIALPNFKHYYKDLIIETVWYWNENRKIDKQDQIDSLDINLCIYGQLNFNKGAKNLQSEKYNICNKRF